MKRPAKVFPHPDRPNRNASYGDSIMASKALPSPEVLRQLLRYEPETGKLFWRERGPEFFRDTPKRTAAHTCANWNSRYAQEEALTALRPDGYRAGTVLNRRLLAHRAIWALATGAWPPEEVDHENGTRDDNRLANLRDASHGENMRNTASAAGSSSRYLGVAWYKNCGKWRAYIRVNRKYISLGYFADEADAARAYDRAAIQHFGEFARPNFKDLA